MTRIRDTFEPDPKAHAIYCELYSDVYKPMYKRLQPLYRAMRRV
jgi:sugar (pentulose or hexulose) kinase